MSKLSLEIHQSIENQLALTTDVAHLFGSKVNKLAQIVNLRMERVNYPNLF